MKAVKTEAEAEACLLFVVCCLLLVACCLLLVACCLLLTKIQRVKTKIEEVVRVGQASKHPERVEDKRLLMFATPPGGRNVAELA